MKGLKITLILALVCSSCIVLVEQCTPDHQSTSDLAVTSHDTGDEACMNCHINEYNKWKRSDHLSSKHNAASEDHITRLVTDTATPAVIKTAALYYLKDNNTKNSASLLIQNLGNNNAGVRYQALRSLSNFPPEIWINSVAPLMVDKVRAVRIAAADLFITIPAAQIPQAYTAAFENNGPKAEDCLRKAIALHTQNPRVYYNYRLILQKNNKLSEAISIVTKGLRNWPRDPDLNYAVCLMYIQARQTEKAKSYALVRKKFYPSNGDCVHVIQILGL